LRSENFTEDEIAWNGGDYDGLYMPVSHGYKAGSVAEIVVVFWFLSPWFLFILGVPS